MGRGRLTAAVLMLFTAVALVYGLTATPDGSRSLRRFEPDRMAEVELRMWQAYYAKERVRLFGQLVTMLHEQNHYRWATAMHEGFYLARAAATFGDTRSNYDRVLSDLEKAYVIKKDWLQAGFQPGAVARAELAWWVARRTPGENSPERVGQLMAEAYALLYEVPQPAVARAATLRAQAAALRDAEAEHPDWDQIGRLLRESYRDLQLALVSSESD